MTKSKENNTTDLQGEVMKGLIKDEEKERQDYLDKHAELEQAWKEVDDERTKVNKLDIEVANLKDENAKLSNQIQNILNNFKDLYTMHIGLHDQIINSLTALNITVGKLSEAQVKFRFVIPETTQQQSNS